MSALCAHIKGSGLLSKLGPPFAFSVWVAARLLLVHSSTVQYQINPNVQFFVNTLRELGAYWGVADRYARLLQQVLDEFADSERAPVTSPTGERANPRSVTILADMRRCAYDLDFLISRQTRPLGPQTSGMTPARTPAPNELEYFDMFDFFNMPRLPPEISAGGGAGGVGVQTFGFPQGSAVNQDYSMADFRWNQNADWFMTPEG